jgi:hypothetical protein
MIAYVGIETGCIMVNYMDEGMSDSEYQSIPLIRLAGFKVQGRHFHFSLSIRRHNI